MYVKKSKLSLFTALLLLCALVMSLFPAAICAEESVSAVSDDGSDLPAIRNVIVTVAKADDSFHVTWTTDLEGDETLQWIEADKLSDGLFPADCYSSKATKEDGVARADLSDLDPDTEYLYRVGNEAEGWSNAYSLATGTDGDNSFSFLFISDPQVGDAPAEVDGLEWYRTIDMAEQWFGDEAEFLMIGGDLVTNGRDEEEFLTFSKPDELRSFPLITTVGNHDEGEPYSRHFTYDDVDTSTSRDSGIYGGSYWLEYDGALIMSLNTNSENMALHRNFIESSINEFTEIYGEPTWKIVLFHHSIYSTAEDRYQYADSTRLEYSSILSEYGVDVVLMGHDHVYTRSYMMDGDTPIDDPSRYIADGDNLYAAYADPADTEVLYVTANAAGDEHYDVADNQLPYAAFTNQEHIPNVTKVDVTPESFSYTVYRTGENNTKEDIVDSFTILRTENAGDIRLTEDAVGSDTEWKYLDDGNYPEVDGDMTAWTTESFDDGAWKSATGSFGSIDGELADHDGKTPDNLLNMYFPEGSDEEGGNIPNFFFRTTFDLSDPESVEEIAGRVWYDDSVNIFINGKKLRDLHVGGVGNTGYSGAEKEEYRTFGYFRVSDAEIIASLGLKESGNILAVELYQSGSGSDDIYFDFESLTFIGGNITLPFTDVKTTSWYYQSVAKAYSKGLFAGVTETTFEPKTTMNRAMVWTVLATMSGADVTGGEKWYSKAQAWAVENGVSDGTNPKNDISRQEIVTMLYSLSGRPAVTGNLDSYTDKGSVSSWAFDALVWATEKDVMTGRGAGILDPRTALTRAEACTVILAYLDVK